MAKGINVINKETINSYQEVINAINEEIKKGTTEITIDIIYQAGEDNIIRMSDQKIKEEWGKLKERVTGEPINSEDIYVRNHGRNG
ncbi:MAG: hypothetical protein II708_04305, partial [Paludibacteraceae bacterium]|nr:hypothetical protein [Paludibacteraceae bacterium]